MGCAYRDTNSFCANLSEIAREKLCPHCQIVQLKKGQQISRTIRPNSMGVVLSGVLAMEVPVRDGGPFSTCIVSEGELVNIIGMVGETRRYDSAFNKSHRTVAVVDTWAALFPITVANELFFDCSLFARALFEASVDRARMFIEVLEWSKAGNSVERVAHLMEQFEAVGVDSADVTHETIGKILGMNRVTVTRAMSKLLRER